MRTAQSLKSRPNDKRTRQRFVGVICSLSTLAVATRLKQLPDLFELRLDGLCNSMQRVDRAIPKLRAPLILTARHPREGGLHQLGARARRDLLLRFLNHAAFIDIELRSVRHLQPIIQEARRRRIGLIISCHDLRDTTSTNDLECKLEEAATCGADIFKIVTRADTLAQFGRLLDFFEGNGAVLPIAAIGIGKFGAESRRRFAQLGSALIYAHLGAANTPGQPSLRQLLATRRAYTI